MCTKPKSEMLLGANQGSSFEVTLFLTNYFEITCKLKVKEEQRNLTINEKITKTQVAIAIVTMAMVKVGGETNILWCMDVGKES